MATAQPATVAATVMAGGTHLLTAPPDRCRRNICLIKWRSITVTVETGTTAKTIALAGEVIVDLSVITATRGVERIFWHYDQVTPADAGGMFKGAMIGVAFDTLVNPTVIIIMPGMASSR